MSNNRLFSTNKNTHETDELFALTDNESRSLTELHDKYLSLVQKEKDLRAEIKNIEVTMSELQKKLTNLNLVEDKTLTQLFNEKMAPQYLFNNKRMPITPKVTCTVDRFEKKLNVYITECLSKDDLSEMMASLIKTSNFKCEFAREENMGLRCSGTCTLSLSDRNTLIESLNTISELIEFGKPLRFNDNRCLPT